MTSALVAGSSLLGFSGSPLLAERRIFGPAVAQQGKAASKKLKLTFKPCTLEMKHVFTIASGSRSTTPVMLTEVEYDGIMGYGEASMPPYLGESHATAAAFLSSVKLGRFTNPFELEAILQYVDNLAPGNQAAKASVDTFVLPVLNAKQNTLNKLNNCRLRDSAADYTQLFMQDSPALSLMPGEACPRVLHASRRGSAAGCPCQALNLYHSKAPAPRLQERPQTPATPMRLRV
jgi:hypothetical protein